MFNHLVHKVHSNNNKKCFLDIHFIPEKVHSQVKKNGFNFSFRISHNHFLSQNLWGSVGSLKTIQFTSVDNKSPMDAYIDAYEVKVNKDTFKYQASVK